MAKKLKMLMQKDNITLQKADIESCHHTRVFICARPRNNTPVTVSAHVSLMPNILGHMITVKHLDPRG